MSSWNSPYILAFLLGLLAVGLFHFDQKQKKNEITNMSYLKVFTLVTGSILGYSYFVDNTESIDVPKIVKDVTEVITPPVVSNNLGGLYSNLKIKEGPPNF
jgi:hypothetical protein